MKDQDNTPTNKVEKAVTDKTAPPKDTRGNLILGTKNLTESRIRLIERIGTPDQVKAMRAELAKQEKNRAETLTAGHEYKKQFKQKPPKNLGQTNHLEAFRIFSERSKSSKGQVRPAEITPKLVSRLIWDEYAAIVWEESKIDLMEKARKKQKALTDSQKTALSNITHWMIGSEAGQWPVHKSLYLWGPKGTGKTTIVRAAHKVSQYLKQKMGWSGRHFELASLYQTFLAIYSEKDLSVISRIIKGWCALDDLRAEHQSYKHFGNDIPVLSLILIARHDSWKLNNAQTILIGNMPPKDFLNIEGLEYDKIAQQYFTFEFKGDNLRLPKHRL